MIFQRYITDKQQEFRYRLLDLCIEKAIDKELPQSLFDSYTLFSHVNRLPALSRRVPNSFRPLQTDSLKMHIYQGMSDT